MMRKLGLVVAVAVVTLAAVRAMWAPGREDCDPKPCRIQSEAGR